MSSHGLYCWSDSNTLLGVEKHFSQFVINFGANKIRTDIWKRYIEIERNEIEITKKKITDF